MTAQRIPDGLDEASIGDGGFVGNIAGVAVSLLLAGLLGASLTGILAGTPSPTRTLQTPAATLSIKAPARLRSGEFFEVRLTTVAHRDLSDLVIAVEPSLWRDWTVNTMIPAPSEESFEDGRYAFHFGEVKAGDSFEFKIDGQLNPQLFAGTRGAIALKDGETQLGELPLSLTVLP